MSVRDAGFIRFRRSPVLAEIVADRSALALLTLIASRARWHTGPNQHNLAVGEALIGDYKALRFSRWEYRGALDRLEHKWNQITTHRSNHGTIAKLTESAIFDLANTKQTHLSHKKPPPEAPPDFIGESQKNRQQNRHPTATRTAIQPPLTNKEIRKEGNNDDGKALGSSLAGEQPAEQESSSFLENNNPQNKKAWEQFAKYCRGKGGQPTEKGFQTWKKAFKARSSKLKAKAPTKETERIGDFKPIAEIINQFAEGGLSKAVQKAISQ
jgi:hypothetical protein